MKSDSQLNYVGIKRLSDGIWEVRLAEPKDAMSHKITRTATFETFEKAWVAASALALLFDACPMRLSIAAQEAITNRLGPPPCT